MVPLVGGGLGVKEGRPSLLLDSFSSVKHRLLNLGLDSFAPEGGPLVGERFVLKFWKFAVCPMVQFDPRVSIGI